MINLDTSSLEKVRLMVEKRITFHERRKQMSPLVDAMMVKTDFLISTQMPDLTAGPTAKSRLSGLALEKTLAEYPAKEKEADERRHQALESARAKTAVLRRWLEELS